jgi:hypothetical protein
MIFSIWVRPLFFLEGARGGMRGPGGGKFRGLLNRLFILISGVRYQGIFLNISFTILWTIELPLESSSMGWVPFNPWRRRGDAKIR